MTIIEAVKSFISHCALLPELSGVTVNELSGEIGSYSLDPLPGARTIEEDLAGNKLQEFPFVLSSVDCTEDELSRLASSEFYERFADWLEVCSDNGTLPDLGKGKIAERIEATTWSYLFQRGDTAASGIYQINCKLVYEQKGRNHI